MTSRKYSLARGFISLPDFYICFVRPASLFCEECVCIRGTHISDTVQTVHELPLLPNNTAVKHLCINREKFEVLARYLSLGRRSGGDWVST